MVIPYDQLKGIHSLTAIFTKAAKYKVDHGSKKIVRPALLPLYDKNIANKATTVVRICPHLFAFAMVGCRRGSIREDGSKGMDSFQLVIRDDHEKGEKGLLDCKEVIIAWLPFEEGKVL